MRITGGRLKGSRIAVPRGLSIRPTTDKTREAVFSVLGEDIMEARVADLFCGSGALGIEAISRGAESVLFVDSSKSVLFNLKKNIKNLDILNKTNIKLLNAFNIRPKILKNISIVFADPPYKKGFGDKLITLLCLPKFNWYGILALEHESEWRYAGEQLQLLKRCDFGDLAVSFLNKTKKDCS